MKKVTILTLLFVTIGILFAASFAGAGQDPLPADWPDEPGAKPELIGGQKADRPMIFSQVSSAAAPQSMEEADFDIWYGDTQSFGQQGNPQQWVNIMGNVTAPFGTKALSYSLNGGGDQPLSIGQVTSINPRLINAGDFNIEIDTADLNEGDNTVVITAIENNDEATDKSVTVNYSVGNTWPLPYAADWGSSTNIQDIAQVVDGNWTNQGGKLFLKDLQAVGYDRLVSIGDQTWTDYEVVAPVMVKSLDDSGFVGLSNGPAVGFILRWMGHTALNGEQPRLDWKRSGGLGWYRWAEKDGAEGLELRGHDYWIGTSTSKVWEFEVPYLLKMSVQSEPGGTRAYYRLKFWREQDPEPVAWDLEGWGSETASPSGSVALVAHHVEVMFGKVEISDLVDLNYSLTTDVQGSGEVTIQPPGQSLYTYGQQVVLYALPFSGYVFDGWSGDISSKDNPLSLVMTSDVAVTANFVEGAPVYHTYLPIITRP